MRDSLLDVSAHEGARRVALGYLDLAQVAATRLAESDADNALHDFRVGMRRLRACARAYDDVLGAEVGKRLRRRLKRVAAATNPGRDAEVQLDWVLTVGDTEGELERHGVLWLAERLRAEKDAAYALVRAELLDEFGKLEGRLREALSSYVVHHVVGEESEGPRFGVIAGRALERTLVELRADLAGVKTIEDEALAHRARIHGKRLRYLLEPFRNEVGHAKVVVRKCKALQDLLGDLNDLHNLATTVGEALEQASVERARRLRELASRVDDALGVELATDHEPGLIAMLQRVQRDRASMFASLTGEWLAPGGKLDDLDAEVRRLASRLARRPGVEVERKYLLSGKPPRCEGVTPVAIEQGYLPGERLLERVRRTHGPRGVTHVRTVKLGAGIERVEVEEPCDEGVFATLYALTEGRRVHKERFRVADGALEWEIDGFLDRDLWLAEVELASPDAEVIVPDWLAPYVVREVTDEAEYVNARLAR
ncbi:MAG: CHAD domain-containing protein [Sandaracinaceae bacterium]|nr:CHAD domain-containing protein [Sandaracinaceae bacterium]